MRPTCQIWAKMVPPSACTASVTPAMLSPVRRTGNEGEALSLPRDRRSFGVPSVTIQPLHAEGVKGGFRVGDAVFGAGAGHGAMTKRLCRVRPASS